MSNAIFFLLACAKQLVLVHVFKETEKLVPTHSQSYLTHAYMLVCYILLTRAIKFCKDFVLKAS